ncbi:MAG TPA: hypothetical protein VK796_02750, partial [Cytophaga sp.]|nr:hypothetical protein [Cytophaga sp.]
LKVTATICFSFYPDKDNQLIYCPVFMAFSIFRNKTPNEIKSTYSTTSKLRNTWTQDGYAMAKPIMYSNVQKISFNISRDDIIAEDGTFKLAVHSFISPHIKAGIPELKKRIAEEHQFSIVITVEEKLPKNKLTGRLYSEMIAINTIQSIGTIEDDADLDL